MRAIFSPIPPIQMDSLNASLSGENSTSQDSIYIDGWSRIWARLSITEKKDVLTLLSSSSLQQSRSSIRPIANISNMSTIYLKKYSSQNETHTSTYHFILLNSYVQLFLVFTREELYFHINWFVWLCWGADVVPFELVCL